MTSVERLVLLLLFMAVVVSAFAVVYSKYSSRKVFTSIEKLTRELDFYDVEWGQLQLEQNTLATHARVERLAVKKLHMIIPDREEIVYLKP